jgi:hypothetical protein
VDGAEQAAAGVGEGQTWTVADGDFFPLERAPASGVPSDVDWPHNVEARWRYSTPHGAVLVGVGAHGDVPPDADNLVHVAGEHVPSSWLPLGPHEGMLGNIAGRLFSKRRVLHAGTTGQIGSTPLHVHQPRLAGWALSRKRRAVRLQYGNVDLKLTLARWPDSAALLVSGSTVWARLRVQAGLTNREPRNDVDHHPFVECRPDVTPEQIALFILVAECELPEEASHPLRIFLDVGL